MGTAILSSERHWTLHSDEKEEHFEHNYEHQQNHCVSIVCKQNSSPEKNPIFSTIKDEKRR